MLMKKRKRVMPAVPVTSMGDIAFLLIIFFIVAAQFAKESHVKLDLPEEAEIAKVERSPISVSIDEDGQVWIDGKETSVDAVEAKVGSTLQTMTTKEVHFKCDARLPRRIYEPVLIAISEAGGTIVPLGEKVARRD